MQSKHFLCISMPICHFLLVIRAYGERLVFDQLVEKLQTKGVENILSDVLNLYTVDCIERDLGWFMRSGLVNKKQANAIVEFSTECCSVIARQSLALVEAFGVPEQCIVAPIAGDWVKYNEVDNLGEVIIHQ